MNLKPGYLLVIGTPIERTGMDRYQERLPSIYREYGGYRLVMGGQSGGVDFLEGGLSNLSMMLARFPSPENVSDFWWSEDYRQAYILRKRAGKFSAVGLPGLDRELDPFPGDRGYLVAMATPESPGRWRRFADALSAGLKEHGATILVDAGPEAIERLESLLPGSHVLVAMLPSADSVKTAWKDLAPGLTELRDAAEPVNIVALAGLPDNHPWRLTRETADVA